MVKDSKADKNQATAIGASPGTPSSSAAMTSSSPNGRWTEQHNTAANAVTISPAVNPRNERERSRSISGQMPLFGHTRSPIASATPGRRSLPTSPMTRQHHHHHHVRAPIPFVPNLIVPSSPLSNMANSGIIITEAKNAPSSSSSLEHTLQQRKQNAIRSALETEKLRISRLEEAEQSMTSVEELKKALKRERQHSVRLASDLAALRVENVQGQAEAEIHEEGRINALMRRLECLQREKGRIIVELEREEEMLTNTLQKKLNEVRREKMLLERQIEQEHLHNTHLLNSTSATNTSTTTTTTPVVTNATTNENSTTILPKKRNGGMNFNNNDIELNEDDEEEEEDDDCGEQVMLEDLAGIQQEHDDGHEYGI